MRAWTLLVHRYAEVRATGLWLFRRDPLCDRRFPSLFAASRATPARKVDGAEETSAPPDETLPDAGGPDGIAPAPTPS